MNPVLLLVMATIVAVLLAEMLGDEIADALRADVPDYADLVPAPAEMDAGYSIRRVCVDLADEQSNYLSGGERVGDPFNASDFGLAGTVQMVHLSDAEPENHYQYFFAHTLSGGAVHLAVTDVGASALGLGSDRVYPVKLTATDDSIVVADDPDTPEDEEEVGATAHLDIGVWVDTTTLSPNDDGLCS